MTLRWFWITWHVLFHTSERSHRCRAVEPW